MTARISLALTLHNHQPIGNFGWVFAEVFEQAYRPMIEALGRHPGVHVGLHYSGPLLEWLRAEQPGFIADVRALVDRGQVEILGGGLYEPILAALPQRDRIGQLRRMADAVAATFGSRPRGAWLAERVWEPDLPVALAEARYDWTILDDAHFRAAGIPDDAMWGPYIADDQRQSVTVFGTEQGLRYLIPFHDVEEVVEHLREHATEAGDRLGTMGDDGEKFGAWPSTFEHCWGKGRWVERFLEALDANAGWLTTVRPSDWLDSHPPVGRAAIPTGSYAEMGEWALPPDEGRAFGTALKRSRETGAPEARWLRGASWRNFQVKYREVNDLHKQMLRASAAVDATVAAGLTTEAARDHLYRGQSNDAYWHGLFGGVYLPHLRAATLSHLIAAEDVADAAIGKGETFSEIGDIDLDGRDEVRIAAAGQAVVIDLDEGAGIGSWDLRAARHALASVLRRRPEAYHETLRLHEERVSGGSGAVAGSAGATTDLADSAVEAGGAGEAGSAEEAPASIHELVQVKEAGLAEHLIYDDYERRSGLIRFVPLDMTPESWRAGGRGDLGDFVDGPFALGPLERQPIRVSKDGSVTFRASRDGSVSVEGRNHPVRVEIELAFVGGRLEPTVQQRVSMENRGGAPLEVRVGSEWAITMLGGGGNPQAWWELGEERTGHDVRRAATGVERLAQGNDWLGVELATTVEPAADAWIAPIETVSNSESGFERVYQGSALLLSWPITLAPGERWTSTVRHLARFAVDRALADGSSQ